LIRLSDAVTPPGYEQTRTTVLLTAFGCGLLAVAALAALLLLGLSAPTRDEVVATPSAATASADRVREQARRTSDRRSEALAARVPDGQLFAPGSFWNKRLRATAPLDPSSAPLVQNLAAEAAREQATGIGPWISAGPRSSPLYQVRLGQRRVRVRLDNGGQSFRKSLQRAFASVPIPAGATPAPLPDGHMTVWQPATDKLWEFFGARREADGWHARWGGAIRRVSKSRGYYTRAAWRGAKSAWGATASSLPVIGGAMLLAELKRGRIDHALAMNVPFARAGVFAWPAQRTDGEGPATALPEGARLRLDPTLDVGELGLPKLTRMMARAAQRYGIVVRDQTGHGISFFGENPSQFRGTPYRRYFRGRTPQEILAEFPWDRLQVLEMHLCTAAPCKRH
jgi:hypothetical protein